MQYMPQIPNKCGIKVWVLGDSSNECFVHFTVYTGKQENVAVKGLGFQVVLSLAKQLQGKKHVHIVYFDNFFTSVELLDVAVLFVPLVETVVTCASKTQPHRTSFALPSSVHSYMICFFF